MRTMLIIASGALTFGLAAGYAWSAMTAAPPRPPAPGKAGFVPIPASPEERPAELDQEWTERSSDKPAACNDGADANGIACEPHPAN